MSNNDAIFEIGRTNVIPGQLLREESYKGLSDHPEYMKIITLDNYQDTEIALKFLLLQKDPVEFEETRKLFRASLSK